MNNAAAAMLTGALVKWCRCRVSVSHPGLPLVEQHLPEVWGAGCHNGSVQGDEVLTNHESKVTVGRLCLTATAGSLQERIKALKPYAWCMLQHKQQQGLQSDTRAWKSGKGHTTMT